MTGPQYTYTRRTMFTYCEDVNRLIIDCMHYPGILKLGMLNRAWRAYIRQFEPYLALLFVGRLVKKCGQTGLKIRFVNTADGRAGSGHGLESMQIYRKSVNNKLCDETYGVGYWLLNNQPGRGLTKTITIAEFCMEMAHMNGYVSALDWFSTRGPSNYNLSNSYIVRNGPAVLEWWARYLAANRGQIDLEIYAYEIIKNACKYGQIDILTWCMERGFGPSQLAYLWAENRIEVLDWLLEYSFGHLSIDPHRWTSQEMPWHIAEPASRRSLDYIPSQNPPCFDMFYQACAMAHLSVLDWLIKHFGARREYYDVGIFEEASAQNNTCVLNWLKHNLLPSAYGRRVELYMGQMSCVALCWWAREIKDPNVEQSIKLKYDNGIICTACMRENFQAANWWTKQTQFPVQPSIEILYNAFVYNKHRLLNWWADNDLPNCSTLVMMTPNMTSLEWLEKYMGKRAHLGPEALPLLDFRQAAMKTAIMQNKTNVLGWLLRMNSLYPEKVPLIRLSSAHINLAIDHDAVRDWLQGAIIKYYKGECELKLKIGVHNFSSVDRFNWWATIYRAVNDPSIIDKNTMKALIKYYSRYFDIPRLENWVQNIQHVPMPKTIPASIFTEASKRGNDEVLNWWLKASKKPWFINGGHTINYQKILENALINHQMVVTKWCRDNGVGVQNTVRPHNINLRPEDD